MPGEAYNHVELDPLLSGFHVDINARPYRYATAILYLTTTTDGSGATIFPCANGNLPAIEAATSLLESGVYHTDHALTDDSLRDRGKALLGETNNIRSLFVQPAEGKLCVFFTCNEDGQCDPSSWHGAGTVSSQSSISKWTLQCFKEIPSDARGTEERRADFVKCLRHRLIKYSEKSNNL